MAKPVMWVQRDGTKINVDDMSEEHVRNALKMVIRKQNNAIKRAFKQQIDREMHDAARDSHWR